MPEEKRVSEEEAFLQVALKVLTETPGQRVLIAFEKPDGSQGFIASTNSRAWNLGIVKIVKKMIVRDMNEHRNRDAEDKATAESARAFAEAATAKKGNVQ